MATEASTADLRRERDRFLGFAFAAADALVELDAAGVVHYALGATLAVFGERSEDLLGRMLEDLAAAEDRGPLRAMLDAMAHGGRAAPLRVRFATAGAAGAPAEVQGHRVADLGDRTFLLVRLAPAEAVPSAGEGDALESYGRDVARLAAERAAQGRATEMTMIHLGGLATLRGRLDDERREALRRGIGARLEGLALAGGLTRQVGEETYSIVHDAAATVENALAAVAGMASELGAGPDELRVRSATLALDAAGATSAQAARALAFALKRFDESPEASQGHATLSDACRAVVTETIQRASAFRRVVSAGEFDLALQPIVDLGSRAIHHYEVLCRFRGELAGSPHRVITFAEEVGAITEFDLSVIRRSLAVIERVREGGRDIGLAVNLSVHSLESESFVAALNESLGRSEAIRPNLIFEITETGRIKDLDHARAVISDLRAAGTRVYLDDFGAGSSAFQYLRALPVDGVKIDGLYVREALDSERAGTFLKAMVYLCRELGVEVVGEMIENEETARFLAACGVQLGQGFLFGRPVVPQAIAGRLWLPKGERAGASV